MTLAYYFWRRWGNDLDSNGLLIVIILATITAAVIYTIDFLVNGLRRKYKK
jgi:hypothetical protein